MAAHFDSQGNPDRLCPKATFFWDQLQTFLTVVGVSILLRVIFLILPGQLISLPKRDY